MKLLKKKKEKKRKKEKRKNNNNYNNNIFVHLIANLLNLMVMITFVNFKLNKFKNSCFT